MRPELFKATVLVIANDPAAGFTIHHASAIIHHNAAIHFESDLFKRINFIRTCVLDCPAQKRTVAFPLGQASFAMRLRMRLAAPPAPCAWKSVSGQMASANDDAGSALCGRDFQKSITRCLATGYDTACLTRLTASSGRRRSRLNSIRGIVPARLVAVRCGKV